MYTNGLKDRFGSPLISKRDLQKSYSQENFAKRDEINEFSQDNTFTSNVTFSKEVTHDFDIIKTSKTSSPSENSILNKGENDILYAQFNSKNVLTETNTFEKTIIAQDGVHATGGNVVITDGVLTFEDTIDGTVVDTINPNASGYRYIPGIPGSFDNGVCYDIGEISDSTDLSSIRFSAEGRLVQTCELWFTTSATPSTKHKWPTGIYWIDSATGDAPTLLASKNYRLVFRQEPNKIIASIAYLY